MHEKKRKKEKKKIALDSVMKSSEKRGHQPKSPCSNNIQGTLQSDRGILGTPFKLLIDGEIQYLTSILKLENA